MDPDDDRIRQLQLARDTAAPIELPANGWELTEDEAYDLQAAVAARRMQTAGSICGYKVAAGPRPPIGRILSSDVVRDGGVLQAKDFLAPRVEPELAFVLGAPLSGPGLTAADVLLATDHVLPAFEIIDSRLSLGAGERHDFIADNAGFARVVLGGPPTPLGAVDVRAVDVELQRGGGAVARGATSRSSGGPADAVLDLLGVLQRTGVVLEAGSIIMTGSCTPPVGAVAGDTFTARFGAWGTVTVSFL